MLYTTGAVGFFLDEERLTAFLDALGPASFAGFIALQVAQVVAAPVPGEATGFIGGFLFGPTMGVILSTVGLTIGSFVAFMLSRFLGRPLVEKLVSHKTLDRFDYLLHHRTVLFVFILFLIPGFPKDVLSYVLGLGRLSVLEFLLLSGTGRLLGTIMISLAGSYLRVQAFGKLFALTGLALVIIILTLAFRDRLEESFRKRFRKGTKEI